MVYTCPVSRTHAPSPTDKDPASQNPDGEDSEDNDPKEMHGVLVSHKCLLKFLSSHVISTTTIACVYTACPCPYPSTDACVL